MIIPNWQHYSNKNQGRTLKPQALRQAKKRTKQFIKSQTHYVSTSRTEGR